MHGSEIKKNQTQKADYIFMTFLKKRKLGMKTDQ